MGNRTVQTVSLLLLILVTVLILSPLSKSNIVLASNGTQGLDSSAALNTFTPNDMVDTDNTEGQISTNINDGVNQLSTQNNLVDTFTQPPETLTGHASDHSLSSIPPTTSTSEQPLSSSSIGTNSEQPLSSWSVGTSSERLDLPYQDDFVSEELSSSNSVSNDSSISASLGLPNNDATAIDSSFSSDSSSIDYIDPSLQDTLPATQSTPSSSSPTNESSSAIQSTPSSSSPTNETSSAIQSTPSSSSPTNETSSLLTPSTPSSSSPTNETSSDIGPTSKSLLNNGTANIESHTSTNGSVFQFAVSNPDTSSGILLSSDPNSVENEIRPGDSQEINFRDVSDNTNSTKSAKIKFDKPGGQKIGDNATLTITDKTANLDPNAINTIVASISSSSDQSGILVVFTETGPNTGEFRGSFLLSEGQSSEGPAPSIKTKVGDNIKIVYVASHSALTATLNGVTKGGKVTITDFALSPTQKTFIDWNPIGNGANLSFTNVETTLDSNVTITMSYANAFVAGEARGEFVILKSNNGDDWELVNNLATSDSRPVINQSSMTVTVTTNIDTTLPTIFMIGSCLGCGGGGFGSPGGGGGGGVPLPGNGVVLDFLTPVISLPPSPPQPGPTPSPPIPTSSRESLLIATFLESSRTSSAVPVSLSITNSSIEHLVNTSSVLGQVSDSKSNTLKAANFTVTLPQVGTVVLDFENLLSQGPINLTSVESPSDLSGLGLKQTGDSHKPVQIKIDNSTYSVIGIPIQIGPPSIEFESTLTVSVPYNGSLLSGTDDVRLLYSDGGNWEDLTTGANNKKHFVTGELESLGVVVAAVKPKA